MAKKNEKAKNLETTPAPEGLVPVRLKADAPYGRVVVGTVVVERTKAADADWPLIPAAELERLSEEYGLEAVPADEE
jgi:hypothetical protein